MKLQGFIPPIKSAIYGGGQPGDCATIKLEVFVTSEQFGQLYDLRGEELEIDITVANARSHGNADSNGDQAGTDCQGIEHFT